MYIAHINLKRITLNYSIKDLQFFIVCSYYFEGEILQCDKTFKLHKI